MADVFHHLGPEGEKPALYRFDRVNGAASTVAKVALPVLRAFRLAQPNEMTGAVDIALFEFGGGEAKMLGSTLEVVFSQIDIAFDITAAAAAGLACESETISRVHAKGSVRVQIRPTIQSIALSSRRAPETAGPGCFAG